MSLFSDWVVNTARGVGNVFNKYYENISKPIGRGISTALLLTDKDNPEFQDGFQLSDVKATYNKYAKDISPGQALLSASELSPLNTIGRSVSNIAETIAGKPVGPTMWQGSFDIYDAAQRKKAFSDEMTGKILSGTLDAAVTWYADPLSKVGKVMKVARGGGKLLGKEFEGVLDPKLGVKTDFSTDAWDTFLKFAVQDTTDSVKLLPHRIVDKSSNPELLASVLGDIRVSQFDKPELIAKFGSAEDAAVEVARTVMQAATGNQAAKLKIWNSPDFAKYAAKIDRAKGELDPWEWMKKAEKDANASGDVNKWLADPKNAEIYDKVKKELQSLMFNDQRIANAIMLTADEIVGTGASRFVSIEAKRIGKAVKTSNNIILKDFPKDGPFGIALKVPQFFRSETPSGWVRNKGIGSSGSYKELAAFGNTVKAWDNPEGIKVKQKLLDEYARANTDEAIRQKVIDKFEKQALFDTAKLIKPDVTKQEVAEFYKRYQQKRSEIIDSIKRGGKTGFIVEDGTVYSTRQLSSQIANATPMVDIKAFARIIKMQSGKGGTFAGLIERTNTGYDIFNAIWKPSVLLRFGYTIRNVTEGSLRAVAMLGSLSQYFKYATRSTAESVKDAFYTKARMRALSREVSVELGLPKSSFLKFEEAKEIYQRQLVVARQKLKEAEDILELEKKNLKSAKNKAAKVDIQKNIKKFEKEVQNNTLKVQERVRLSEAFDKKYSINPRVHKFSNLYLNRELGVGINDAFAGDLGIIANDISSASRRTAIELQSQNAISRINAETNLVSRGYQKKIEPPKYDANGKLIVPVGAKKIDTQYYNAAHDAARQFREDAVGLRILLGQSSDDIIRAAKTDKVLQKDLINSGIPLNTDDISYHVKFIEKSILEYFPDEALRKKIAVKIKGQEVTVNDIRNALEGRSDLVAIHGETFELAGMKKAWVAYQDATAKLFKILGSAPEDMLVRHPLYVATFRKTMDELVSRKVAEVGKARTIQGITNGEFQGLEKTAHRMALKELEATAYTIQRYSTPASYMSYVAPFYAAFENTFRTWGKLTYQNPEVIGRLNLLWHTPERAGLTETDPRTNETWVTMQLGKVLPDWLEKRIGNNTVMKFPKQGVNLIFQGEPWWSPGFGPIAQIPANVILKNSPDINYQLSQKFGFYVPAREALNVILPLGASENAYSIVTSASIKRLTSLMRGTADKDYVNQLQAIYATERQRWKQGDRPDEPTFDEVKSKNNWMMTLRFVSSLTLPFQPRFSNEFGQYVKIWQQYQTEGELNGETPAQRFYRDYPEYFTLAYSGSSATTGMDFTQKAVFNAKNNRNLVSDVYLTNPYLIQLITNDGKVEEKFDQAAYVWQMENSPVPGSKESFRGQLDPISEVKRQDIKAGWIEFNKLNSAINAQLEMNGILSINSPEAEPLRRVKEQVIKEINQKYPEWEKDRETFTLGKWKETIRGIDRILQDENFINNLSEENKSAWAVMQDYMDSRDYVINILQSNKAIGGSASLEAQENAALREQWDAYVMTMKKENTTFSEWYDRFLEADKLEPINL
jgi:hypothetical protein